MAYLGDVRYGVWNDRGHERDEVKIAITLAQPPQSAACGQSGIYADGEQRQRHDDQHKHVAANSASTKRIRSRWIALRAGSDPGRDRWASGGGVGGGWVATTGGSLIIALSFACVG